jgi:transposase-like protein
MIQEIITYQCTACKSTNIVKNGKNQYGKQQFKCKDCGKQAVLNPGEKYSQVQKEQILATYQERPSRGVKSQTQPPIRRSWGFDTSSMRGIERIYGVSRNTLSSWLKKSPRL